MTHVEFGGGAVYEVLGLEGDEPPGLEHPKDRRDRRGAAGALRQVVVDGRRTGIKSVVGQLLVQGHDLVLEEVGNTGRGPMRPQGTWLEAGGSFEAVATQELEEPAGTHLMGPGQLLDRPPGP
jgi:hypothetical protein